VDVPWDARFEPIIRRVLLKLDADEPITPDLNTASAGLDSLGAVELLGMIESEYDIVVPDDQLSLGSFATPGMMWNLVVSARLGASAAARHEAEL
jgi:acyl carrier protein